MAYPCGGTNFDQRVVDLAKERTGVKYARTIISSYSFDLQENLYAYNPTIHSTETEKLFELGDKFLKLNSKKYQIFYIWGHTYEFDSIGWDDFKNFLKMMSDKDDILYYTNREAFSKAYNNF